MNESLFHILHVIQHAFWEDIPQLRRAGNHVVVPDAKILCCSAVLEALRHDSFDHRPQPLGRLST